MMKICVNEILKQGLDVERELDPSALGLEASQIPYPSGIKVKVRLEKEKDTVYAKISIKTKESMDCSKCLERFDSNFEQEEDFVYKLSNEHFIDLTDDVKDAIILAYPIRQLCKADCKGLCQACGANLNQGACGCVK